MNCVACKRPVAEGDTGMTSGFGDHRKIWCKLCTKRIKDTLNRRGDGKRLF